MDTLARFTLMLGFDPARIGILMLFVLPLVVLAIVHFTQDR